jgi:FtsH-binding integral membrane protein
MLNQARIEVRPAVAQRPEARAEFLSRTYGHLFAAILAFTLLELALFASGLALPIAKFMLGTSWLVVLGGFVLVSWIASRVAHRTKRLGAQYLALAGCVVAEGILFLPLLVVAQFMAPGVIRSAALVTLLGFTALTVLVFATRRDFSFLRSLLVWAGLAALLLIAAGTLFGFQPGTYFSVAMVALAGAAILYDTSNVMLHYSEDRYVAAALELFASVALMFWYVLRLFLSARR